MKVTAVVGDLTKTEVDVVVNAANSTLMGGGGVDGALHRAAGSNLLEACKAIRAAQLPNGLPVGQAIATRGFNLPAKWVVHTVGPNRHRGEDDPELLAACVHSSCAIARQLGARTMAFPAISAGAYGWTMESAASILVRAAFSEAFASEAARARGEADSIEEIRFVLLSQSAADIFLSFIRQHG